MIQIIAIGKLKDPNLRNLFDEYKKRLEAHTKIEVIELKDERKIPSYIKDRDMTVILDEKGENITSKELSDFIKENTLTKKIAFIIGGLEGLENNVMKKANKIFSLSKMTFTSQMARIILIEQIYRAQTIMRGVNYHK